MTTAVTTMESEAKNTCVPLLNDDSPKPTLTYTNPMTPGTPIEFQGMYDWYETIGKGRYSTVKRAEHVITRDSVAVKIIDKVDKTEDELNCIKNEIDALKSIDNSHVVRLYQVVESPSRLYLILEYGEGGDLYEHMSANGRLSENRARHIFEQILVAVEYCHANNITHRDLKAENILFTDLHAKIVKVSDFGFCTEYKDDEMLLTMCGSLAYSAPEVLLQEPYSGPATDMWSLGVILYLLVTGDLPFAAQNDAMVVTQIMDLDFVIPQYVTEDCQQLILKLILQKPAERLTSSVALAHPWVTKKKKPAEADAIGIPPSPLPKTKQSQRQQQPQKGSLMIKRSSTDSNNSAVIVDHAFNRRATLVSRNPNDIKKSEKARVVAEMIVGGLKQEDIEAALVRNEFDFITSTFYLLLEQESRKRRGSKRRSGIMKKSKHLNPTSTTQEGVEPIEEKKQNSGASLDVDIDVNTTTTTTTTITTPSNATATVTTNANVNANADTNVVVILGEDDVSSSLPKITLSEASESPTATPIPTPTPTQTQTPTQSPTQTPTQTQEGEEGNEETKEDKKEDKEKEKANEEKEEVDEKKKEEQQQQQQQHQLQQQQETIPIEPTVGEKESTTTTTQPPPPTTTTATTTAAKDTATTTTDVGYIDDTASRLSSGGGSTTGVSQIPPPPADETKKQRKIREKSEEKIRKITEKMLKKVGKEEQKKVKLAAAKAEKDAKKILKQTKNKKET